jgi:hypothetical protein
VAPVTQPQLKLNRKFDFSREGGRIKRFSL